MIFHQAANDEVAVPAIHLVKSSAGDDVFFRQVQQALRLNLAGIDLAKMMNCLRKPFDLNLALLLKLLHVIGHTDIRGQVQHGRDCELGVNHRFAIRHRAGERVPPVGDVLANGIEARC